MSNGEDTIIHLIVGLIKNISSLATKTALTAVENKIRDGSSLVRKTYYNRKISELEKN